MTWTLVEKLPEFPEGFDSPKCFFCNESATCKVGGNHYCEKHGIITLRDTLAMLMNKRKGA